MGAGAGLIMLDETVVGVALPTLRDDLGMSKVAAHWVVSAYMLVFAGIAAASGRIGDIVGFKTLIIAGAAIFGLVSLAAGFAQDGTFLIAARAVEGIGAAVIFPATFAMLMLVFPKEQRGMAIGVLAAIGTMFLAVGPLVGGFLTEIVSWRWIFWVNVPIVAMIVLIVLLAWVDPPRKPEAESFDTWGLVTLVAGLTLLVFAIMQGAAWGWTEDISLTCLVGGIVLLGLFIIIERGRIAPLIAVDLFASPSFSACIFVIFVGQFSKITIVVFGALYLQDNLGMSPLTAGLALLVSVAAFLFLSAPVGRQIRRPPACAHRYSSGHSGNVLARVCRCVGQLCSAVAWFDRLGAWHAVVLCAGVTSHAQFRSPRKAGASDRHRRNVAADRWRHRNGGRQLAASHDRILRGGFSCDRGRHADGGGVRLVCD